jgi:replicative DNA helicase
MTTAERKLPQNLDAESGVIGSILLNPSAFDDVANIVSPNDFILGAHGVVFSHALSLHNSGKTPDERLLLASLKKSGEMNEDGNIAQVGGAGAFLDSLFNRVPTASNAVYYAKLVREASAMRSLICACESIANEAYDPGIDADAMLSKAEARLFSVTDCGREETLVAVGDVLEQAMEALPRNGKPSATSGISSGYPDLDHKLGGFFPGQLVIVAGRPSMGKTALVANMLERISLDQQVPSVFFSIEMCDLEIGNRMLFCRARVAAHRGRADTLTDADRGLLVKAQNEYSQAKLHIDTAPYPSVGQMASACRRLKRKNGLGLVVIDYLQLIQPENTREPRQEQVAGISRRLKRLAKELSVPVICVAQLNRQTETSTDHRPRLSHLRESGAIEQDADVVLFCHREEYYAAEKDKESLKGQAEIIVAKQRNGPTGGVPVAWLEEFMRFESAYKPQQENPNQYRNRVSTPSKGKHFDASEWPQDYD